MDIQRFIKILKRFIWILILVPVFAATITYYLVLDLPNEFRSEALISTGLVDHSQNALLTNNEAKFIAVNQQFNNLIERLTIKKNLNVLSYKLMLHDLENPQNAFQEIPESIARLDSNERKAVIDEYKIFLAEEKIISPEDNKNYPLFDYISLMEYDEETIKENLDISRKENSDFIKIGYLSNNPYLSVYVVNSISNDFISSYKERTSINQNSSKVLLDSLLQGKEASMNAKNAQIKDFQVKNSAISLVNQAEGLYTQISQKESQRAAAVGEIQSLQGAIQGIEAKLKNKNSDLMSVSISENNQIVSIKNQLQKANERYVDNNFRPEDALRIDSLQNKLSGLIASSASSSASDPRVLRQSLIQQKLAMEVELDRVKSGLSVILADLARMKGKYNQMVPKDAGIKNFEREAEVATKEYLNTLDLYNKNSVLSSSDVRPQLVQAGVVNPPEPSKAFLYIGLAGIGSFGTCLFILIIGFLLDQKIRTSEQLVQATGNRILGQINNIVPNNTDLKTVWAEGKSTKDYSLYKDLIRSLRFEIDSSLKTDQQQIIGITGLFTSSGSSFISSSLAYSFAVAKKRVLLIGGDYILDKKAETKEIAENQYFDSYIVKREIRTEEFITKLTTNAQNESLLEIYNEGVLRKGFEELKKDFDIIIVDVDSLQKIHRAKEWLMFVEKSIAIFPAGSKIGSHEKKLISFINRQKGFMGWVLNKTKVNDMGLLNAVNIH